MTPTRILGKLSIVQVGRMKTVITSSLVVLLITVSCHQEEQNWIKLTEEQTYQYLINTPSPFKDLEFRDSLGKKITNIDTALVRYGWYQLSMWIDSTKHSRKRILLGPGNYESEIFMIRVQGYADFKTTPMADVEVDCRTYATLLDSMLYWDQGIRNGTIEGTMFDIDFKNQSLLIKLVDECGWPSFEQVGEEGLTAMALVALHAWNTTQTQFYPIIKDCTEKGLLNPHFLATLVDRILVSNERMQVFGTQLTEDEANGTLSLDPIRDMEGLEARRTDHGLISMKEYMALFGLNWPLEPVQPISQH